MERSWRDFLGQLGVGSVGTNPMFQSYCSLKNTIIRTESSMSMTERSKWAPVDLSLRDINSHRLHSLTSNMPQVRRGSPSSSLCNLPESFTSYQDFLGVSWLPSCLYIPPSTPLFLSPPALKQTLSSLSTANHHAAERKARRCKHMLLLHSYSSVNVLCKN